MAPRRARTARLPVLLLALGMLAVAAPHAEASSPKDDDIDLAHVPMWGTYRPQAFISVRARVPHSPFFGVAYHPADSAELRHLASDHQSAVHSFGFSRHDGKSRPASFSTIRATPGY
jgi:hypothetical protein